MMRRRDLDSFRTVLEGRLSELYASRAEARDAVSLETVEDESLGDEGDEATRVATRELRMSLAETGTVLAVHIGEALDRMANGHYGTCADCDEEIETKRLRVIPWTIRCIDCQETFESKSRDRSPSL